MPESQPPRRGKMRSIAALFGVADQAHKRPVIRLFNGQEWPNSALPFKARMKWFARVQRLVAACNGNGESHPHKVIAVAHVIARIDDQCFLDHSGIAERAGCVERTVQACIDWLEEHGVLTWSHTAKRHQSGRIIRSHNIYRLILDFVGFQALVVRARRAVWRERKPSFSNSNACCGIPPRDLNIDPYGAMRRLAELAKQRTDELNRVWQQRHAV
jgi:hypothetical protein